MIPHFCPFELEIKIGDEDEIFRKFRRKIAERMADFEKPRFSLEKEIFKSMTNDGERCAGEMYCWKRILKQAENFSFGGRREDQNQGKTAVKLATDDLSLKSSSLQVLPDSR